MVTDIQTNRQTFTILESLLRLKNVIETLKTLELEASKTLNARELLKTPRPHRPYGVTHASPRDAYASKKN